MDHARIHRRARRGAAGFTLLEVSLASTVLMFVMWSGMSLCQGALVSLDDSTSAADEQAKTHRSNESLEDWLQSASVGSLEGTPYGGVPEPMLEEVVYDNMSFRRVVAVGAAGPVFEPDIGLNPIEIKIVFGNKEFGDLCMVLDQREIILLSDVTGASFVRYGNRIEITVAYVGGDEDKYGGNEGEKLTRSFLLRTP